MYLIITVIAVILLWDQNDIIYVMCLKKLIKLQENQTYV